MAERAERRSEDRRVKRTKKALRDCLFQLLDEKSADEITVKELTSAADINRSTFYFYYKDIDDITNAFARFARLVPKDGCVFGCGDDPRVYKLLESLECDTCTFGLQPQNMIRAEEVSYDEDGQEGLLPGKWEIEHIFNKRSQPVIYVGLIGFYLLFYVYSVRTFI